MGILRFRAILAHLFRLFLSIRSGDANLTLDTVDFSWGNLILPPNGSELFLSGILCFHLQTEPRPQSAVLESQPGRGAIQVTKDFG